MNATGLTCAFQGNGNDAIDHAFTVLSSQGFKADSRTSDRVVMTGPGMMSSRQPPICGASKITLFHDRNQLILDAELGGVERLRRFLLIFPVALSAVLMLSLGIVFWNVFGAQKFPFILLMTVLGSQMLLWLLLAPLITRLMASRTNKALEALLSNAAMAGQKR